MRLSIQCAIVVPGLASLVGCIGTATRGLTPQASQIAAAERIIDAFYSFDSTRLKKALEPAVSALPKVVFYQGWAAGGNYKIVERKPCKPDNRNDVVCAITVKDDLIGALKINFNVTDTFRISFAGKSVAGVRNSSNDPPEFDQALDWVRRERPELIRKPCEGFFKGGPTPGDCVRAMVRGFAEFANLNR
jgi:hypothetical protein